MGAMNSDDACLQPPASIFVIAPTVSKSYVETSLRKAPTRVFSAKLHLYNRHMKREKSNTNKQKNGAAIG